ncbi:hypothetical protein BGW38_005178 [Lunasporangiospora selenospora]|uniref:BEACH domain-containing protein n=1 Tax=Lunasporangiospora selenospora TaxID=979761 RepID=A0A9P6FNU3_9FUNG|nr:hypothetical protein BGW38_005178 [Lunasporangiospora selenospora]
MSYEGAIDLDTIDDHVQKSATIGIIHNFGQTPKQLFKKPHGQRLPPNRDPLSPNFYNIVHHAEYLTQSVIPVKDIGTSVGEILFHGDKIFVSHSQRSYDPYACTRYVEWGFSDNSVRLFQTETNKILGIYENLHLEAITCVKWADDRTIVTTSRDTVVCIWQIVQMKSTLELKLMKCLRGHREAVSVVAVSVAYSVIVSGSEDKSCIVWDLNRLEYVRQLGKHEDGVRVVAINDATGDIATCSGPVLRLWTINGDLLLQKYTTQIGDPILDCIFYAGRTGEWVPKELIFTSHRRGTIKVWEKNIVDARFKNTMGSISISSLQQSMDSVIVDSTNDAACAQTGAGSSSATESENAGEVGSTTNQGLIPAANIETVSTTSVASGEAPSGENVEDEQSLGARSRQSSQATGSTTGAGSRAKPAKWALKLLQAYTYEDRLRIDGGAVPNIVSLHVSR